MSTNGGSYLLSMNEGIFHKYKEIYLMYIYEKFFPLWMDFCLHSFIKVRKNAGDNNSHRNPRLKVISKFP